MGRLGSARPAIHSTQVDPTWQFETEAKGFVRGNQGRLDGRQIVEYDSGWESPPSGDLEMTEASRDSWSGSGPRISSGSTALEST